MTNTSFWAGPLMVTCKTASLFVFFTDQLVDTLIWLIGLRVLQKGVCVCVCVSLFVCCTLPPCPQVFRIYRFFFCTGTLRCTKESSRGALSQSFEHARWSAAVHALCMIRERSVNFLHYCFAFSLPLLIQSHSFPFPLFLLYFLSGLAESFVGKAKYLKRIRYHGKGAHGVMHKTYSHYFLKLREGPPPPKVKPSEKKIPYTRRLINRGPLSVPNSL